MVDLPFAEISRRLRAFPLPEVDLVIGVARGGIVPASLVAHQLGCDMKLLHVNYRDDQNRPRHDDPQVLAQPDWHPEVRRILLVDDVAVSGKTLARARSLFPEQEVRTFVLKGQADYVLFPEVRSCVNWPWKTI